MDLRVRPQLLSSYIAPIERRGCHRSMRVMRWLSQQLGDVADKANGQVIMPYACGHVQGKVKRRCRVISEGQKRLEAGKSIILYPQSTRSAEFNPKRFNSI